jgi:hypothetical protein
LILIEPRSVGDRCNSTAAASWSEDAFSGFVKSARNRNLNNLLPETLLMQLSFVHLNFCAAVDVSPGGVCGAAGGSAWGKEKP